MSVLVSIIIPAYNTAGYIHRAIGSCLSQTYRDIEAIVVDDGSSDDTLRVAMSYTERDNRVRVFHQENAGVSAARNYGIREARGEYLVFLDSDDWLENDAIEVLMNAQAEHPDRLICGDFRYVREDGTSYVANPKVSGTLYLGIDDIARDYCWVKDAHAGFHSAWAKIYSAQILAHNINFPEGIAYSEDAVFVIKYLHRTDGVMFLNRSVYNVLERSGSAIRSSYRREMLKSQQAAYDIMANLPENSPELSRIMNVSRAVYIMMYFHEGLNGTMSGIGSEEMAEIRYNLRPYVWNFITSKEMTLRRKARFLLDMYCPISLERFLLSVWAILKLLLRKPQR